ncbi:MAG TPA: class I SAM-dependent methyltransferase [Bryobacteraceae bacterium]|nr:class I SAM-dependent methyltransferase [Bryobacteraceae bacterium]
MRIVTAVLGTVLLMASAPAQEPKKQPDVPFVPTPKEVVTAMLKLAGVGKDDVVYDLGCGDGRIVVAAAQDFGAKAVGVDINPERIQEAQENAKQAGVQNRVEFIEGDFFEVPVGEATVVTLYLLPSINLKLRPKLLKDLKPGTRIVSQSFDMGDWKPDKEIQVDGRPVYLWRVPRPSQ